MLKKQVFIVVLDVRRSGFGFNWSMGGTLKEARAKYKKLHGYFPTVEAVIVALECEDGSQLPYVNEEGQIYLPSGSKTIKVN